MEQPLIKGYKPGSDITIMNTWRSYSRKQNDGSYSDPSLTIVYRDNQTGLKSHQEITNPDYEFYVLNDDVYRNPDIFTDHIEFDKVHKVSCPAKDLEKTIAKLTNNTEAYWENIKSKRRGENRKLHINNCIFQSDQNLEDHYRYRFSQQYTNEIGILTKGFMDIETDGINALTDFPSPDDSPVNAVTYIYLESKQVYTFLLRDESNPLIEEFEKSIGPELFAELKDFVINQVGGWKQATRMGIIDLSYNFLVYDEEIVMLHELFKLINNHKPDFLLAWNMAFDIPYIIERIKFLGYDPAEILCDPSFETKVCEYFIDENNVNVPEERGDFYKIASTTVYLDQLIEFRSRRKGQKKFPDYKLDSIGWDIAKVRKVDYHHICDSIVKLPRTNYKMFVFYNIIDVIVQVCIEAKVNDIEYVFGKALLNCTRYNKVHRQTTYLTNRRTKSFNSYGLVASNNGNAFNPKPTEKYDGAYVAPPELLSDLYKIKINGIPINVIENGDDFDYKALYPSTARENNMGNDTMIGKIFIPDPLWEKDNRFGNPKYKRGGAYIEDLQSHNYLEFSTRWLGLADYATLIDDIREFLLLTNSRSITEVYYDENGIFRFKHQGFLINDNSENQIKKIGFNQLEYDLKRVGFRKFKEPNYEKIVEFLSQPRDI